MTKSSTAIAVIAAPDYQELEVWYPVLRAREAGLEVTISTADPAGVTSHLGYPLVPTGETVAGAGYAAVVAAGTIADPPAFSAAQRALIDEAAVAGASVYAVGTATTAVPSAKPYASADALPELMQALLSEIEASGIGQPDANQGEESRS